jgi:hypothetical protein
MALENLIAALGDEITDPEEETFLLFSHPIPSQNLGFVDAKATDLELTVAGRDLNITQSPGLLSSNRVGGTTGAVVWKITPLFAEWIAREDNFLFKQNVLNSSSVVLELGCGISGIVGIVLGPKISKYLATDQEYVFKLLKSNIDSNAAKPRNFQQAKKKPKGNHANYSHPVSSNIEVVALDWESSSVSEVPNMIDAVIACDCIYNEALVEPFVRTCAEICQLTTASGKRTMCIIAQQLRSDTVFEAWLSAFHEVFRVWRVPDEVLNEGLRGGSGFVVHVAVLR